ncbi:MAG: DUF47 family protein [Magnetococcales bacterium]|nr:DUF47 family protein [Magnetococcales bacterium]NGZ25923.1 DUF47 family protein [Magnetococcales bacterium]
MGASNSSLFGKMLDNVFPRVPPFFHMFTLQTEILVKGMDVLVRYMEEPKSELVEELIKLEGLANDLREKHLDVLNNAFSTPLDRQDCLDTLTNLDIPVANVRVVVQEMDVLKIAPDKYSLEMAVLLREAASALQRGYAKLDGKPREGDADAQAAILARINLDRAYRKGLAIIYTIDDDIKNLTEHAQGAEAAAMKHVVEMLKRREVYRNMRETGAHLSHIGSLLHGIIVKIG